MPNADMYFLNPAGIVLGKNAQLNVPGQCTLAQPLNYIW